MDKTDRQYLRMALDESMVDPDPFRQFDIWYDEALNSQEDLPNAFALSTVSPDGAPSCRIVLLKGVDHGGFTFYTNTLSRKGGHLAKNPMAAICFFWSTLERQLRIEGTTQIVTDDEADAYFATRPRNSQIGAWASPQSEVVKNRQDLDETFHFRSQELEFVETVPRPPHWTGFRVIPSLFEFWQGRESRMHDRIQYVREKSGWWRVGRLAP